MKYDRTVVLYVRIHFLRNFNPSIVTSTGEVNQANDILVNVDMPKNDSKCAEGCSITSSYDGQESEGKRSTDTEDDGDEIGRAHV